MTGCLFCKIVSGEIPARKVHEDDRVVAFEDIAPKAPTHVLIVPRKHIPKLDEASSEDALVVGEVALRAAAIAREHGLEDYRVVVNNGPGAGQSVFHLHFHLLGGRNFSWPPG
jgi:histidine triad (HIT) family protein